MFLILEESFQFLAMALTSIVFIMLMYIPSMPNLLHAFIMKGC
jgi:hypothetical protein